MVEPNPSSQQQNSGEEEKKSSTAPAAKVQLPEESKTLPVQPSSMDVNQAAAAEGEDQEEEDEDYEENKGEEGEEEKKAPPRPYKPIDQSKTNLPIVNPEAEELKELLDINA